MILNVHLREFFLGSEAEESNSRNLNDILKVALLEVGLVMKGRRSVARIVRLSDPATRLIPVM